MNNFYLPSVTHVTPLTTIRRERVLPIPGVVTVRVNEKVQASHVVAEAESAPRHLFLDIVHGLGVPERQVSKYLVRHEGDRVDAGEVIAGPVGLARRTIRAPANGRIVTISRGRVLFEVRGELYRMRAGFPGMVIATDGTRSVTIQTTGALVQGVWGNGQQDYGVMRIVGDGPVDRLKTDQLDVNLRGAVLVAGICDHPAPLHQATELSVRGVILGGLASDLIPVAQRLPYPVVVIEGFGERPINPPAFSLLSTNVGREVALDAQPASPYQIQRPEVIIPLPATRDVGFPDEVVPLKSGVRVRVLRAPYHGEVGIVQKVLAHAAPYPSGIRAMSATVELGAGSIATVPIANLEVLQ
ncbi:MAG: hypothetical protein E3J37_04280 [Anaerolineales bacterium]|nr:MAG: hypothetical protein E3J37_04280 [Anaerolineales bacterium]